MPGVVCRLATELPRQARRRLGVERRTCDRCGRPVACTPATLELLDAGDAVAVCVQCAADEVLASGRAPSFVLSADTAVEFDRQRRLYADRHNVQTGDVTAGLPPLLVAAVDAVERLN